MSDGACGAAGCGTAVCGTQNAGAAQLYYVGSNQGSYRTDYAYVGRAQGDFEYIAAKKPTYCICYCSIITLLLLGLLLWLLFNDQTQTTTPGCSAFQCPVNFIAKQGLNAAVVQGDLNTCCDRTCGAFQCPPLYAPKAMASNLAGADQLSCCQPSCGLYQCAPGTRKKPNNAQIIGSGQAMCCQGVKKICIVYGDPHSESFDGHHNDFYASGEFWILKSAQFSVQGRYLPTHITRGLSVTKEVSIGGPLLQGHVVRVSSTSVTLDEQPILTAFPGSYKVAGVLDVTYNDHGKILQPHRELGKNLKVLHFNFNGGIFMQINQWTNPEEGNFINVMIEMGPMGGLDGYCGNFNGNPADDDRIEIRKRLGSNGVEQQDLIGFKTKTPIAQDFEGFPSITSCATAILLAAHTKCQAEEGHYIPSMDCLAKKCANGVDA